MAIEEKKDRSVKSARSGSAQSFRAGDRVEYEGKLAKVISFGTQQISAPGQTLEFSDGPVLTIQIPADSIGAKPNTVYNLAPDQVKSLKDDAKRRAALEKEWNAFFGDPVPADPEKAAKVEAPKIRQSGPAPEAKRTSSTRGKNAETAPAAREAMDTSKGKTVDTSKAGREKAAKAPKAAKKK